MFRASREGGDRRAGARPSWSLWLTLLVALFAIGGFPLYTTMVLSPSFTRLLVGETEMEALRVARYFAVFLAEETDALTPEALPPGFLRQLDQFKADGHFSKIKIFSPAGVVVFSTDPTEIGHVNTEGYLRRVTTHGDSSTRVVLKGGRSLESEVVAEDVVEAYVPVTRDGRQLGVLEVYYSISKERQALESLIYRSYGTLWAMALALFLIILFVSIRGQRSIRERDRAEETLRLLSLTDELTGLYNRRGFLALSHSQIKTADRERRPLMVVAADVDGLKEINDTRGHREGDSAIAAAATALRDSFRKSDLVARVGGDEFVALLVGGLAPFDENKVADRLRKTILRHNSLRGRTHAISLSVGFALYEAGRERSLEELLHEADGKMYTEKRLRKRSLGAPS